MWDRNSKSTAEEFSQRSTNGRPQSRMWRPNFINSAEEFSRRSPYVWPHSLMSGPNYNNAAEVFSRRSPYVRPQSLIRPIVDEAGSYGRNLGAIETLNPHADRNLDRWRSPFTAPTYAAVTNRLPQATFQDGASTSSRGHPFHHFNVQRRADEAAVEGLNREMRHLEEPSSSHAGLLSNMNFSAEDFVPHSSLGGLRSNLNSSAEVFVPPSSLAVSGLQSNLNPSAEEFVPSALLAGDGNSGGWRQSNALGSNALGFLTDNFEASARPVHRKQRMRDRAYKAQRAEVIRRTVYVSNIGPQVTEEELARFFMNCGRIVECRVSGYPNIDLRFAFIEFINEEGAKASLGLNGAILGPSPITVLPSVSAIAPVNPKFLPMTEDEREACARTVYCTNIDKTITEADLASFFEPKCGMIRCMSLRGDLDSPRIAFIEFEQAVSAAAALNYSGAPVGSRYIRISPSKTLVYPRPPPHFRRPG